MSELSLQKKKDEVKGNLLSVEYGCFVLEQTVKACHTWAQEDFEKPALSRLYPGFRSTVQDLLDNSAKCQQTLSELKHAEKATLGSADNQLETWGKIYDDCEKLGDCLIQDHVKLVSTVNGLMFPGIKSPTWRGDVPSAQAEAASGIVAFWASEVPAMRMIETLKRVEKESNLNADRLSKVSDVRRKTEKLLERIKYYQDLHKTSFGSNVTKTPTLSAKDVRSMTVPMNPITNTLNHLFQLAIGKSGSIGSASAVSLPRGSIGSEMSEDDENKFAAGLSEELTNLLQDYMACL